MAPVTFLVVGPNGQSDITHDAVWSTVLTSESLVTPTVNPEETGDADVTITQTNALGTLTFSSASNRSVFLDPLPADTFKSTAWVGDTLGSAVFQFLGPIPGPVTIKVVFDAFGIDLTKFAESPSFLQPLLGLNVTLHQDPTPTTPLNAVWCTVTNQNYQVAETLSYGIDPKDAKDTLNKAIEWASSIGLSIRNIPSIPEVVLTVNKLTPYSLSGDKGLAENSLSFRFSLPGAFGNLECSLDYSTSETVFFLRPMKPPDPSIFSAIGEALRADGLVSDELPSSSPDNIFSSFFSHFDLWYLRVQQNENVEPKRLDWEVAILARFTAGSQPVLVGFTYDSRISRYTGSLILKASLPDPTAQRMPDYDRRRSVPDSTLTKLGITNIPLDLSLWELITGQGADHGSPPSIPFRLRSAGVSYSNPSKTRSILTLHAELVNIPPVDAAQNEAPAPFVWDSLKVITAIIKESSQNPKSFINIATSMTLNDQSDHTVPSAELLLSLDYASDDSGGDWTLSGQVRNLSVALLADYFDSSAKIGAMAVLRQINLKELDMTYSYQGGKASSFLISAILQLGLLELDLSYQYVSPLHDSTKKTAAAQKWDETGKPANVKTITSAPDKKAEWAFEAYLHATQADVDIAGVVDGFKPGAGSSLPDFVGGIKIALDKSKSPVKLKYSGDDAGGSVLIAWIEIGPFSLTYIQFRTVGNDPNNPAKVKRILRISADQIPMMDKVPLVNELPQPFDHLLYLWVEDPDQKDENMKGFTRDNLGSADGGGTAVSVNSELNKMSVPPIQVQEPKVSDRLANSKVILKSGSHFMIVANGKVVLDHVFNGTSSASKAKTKNSGGNANSSGENANSSGGTEQAKAEAPVTKGDTNSKAGPLTISALSVQYKDGHILVGIDATLLLGPLMFEVKGFVISIDLTDVKLNDLSSIITSHIDIAITGLEAGVSKPPLTIKGAFVHEKDTNNIDGGKFESFRGGVAVALKAWNILAIGEYRITTSKEGNQNKSVFVFGKLDGPLVELEFATISDVRVGFGFNSQVHLPQAEQLYAFPFISDSALGASGNDPMKVLDLILKPASGPAYVFAKEGSTWFCAGMTIACFDCIKLTAVILFDITTSGANQGVIIALLADGIFQMEPDSTDPNLTLFYVELLIKVEINFTEGYIAADAALAPTSHIYVPEARLTGSGSFYSWFPPNENAGDWVISIGGYHRAFAIPLYYPHPNRLGLNFTVGDNIHVLGEGYCAVTPKCAMAGGHLHMSLEVGPVTAWCDVTLDVFINFKPFYFVAGISLSVGVDCDIHVWFIHIHISVSLGADMKIWGPDRFGGLAHVDFWFFGFDIRFGGSLNTSLTGIPLDEFYGMLLKSGPTPEPATTDDVSKNNPFIGQHKYSLEGGLFPNVPPPGNTPTFPNTGAQTAWTVQAGTLQIKIDCGFALSQVVLVVDEAHRDKDRDILAENKDVDKLPDVFSYPMHNTVAMHSRLEVRVYNTDTRIPELQDWRAEFVFKEGSKALWQQYDIKNDPLFTPNPLPLSDPTHPTTTLCQGVRLRPPEAHMGYTPILDFDATKAMIMQIHEPYSALASPQTDYNSEYFEQGVDAPQRWDDFGSLLAASISNGQTADGLSKAEIRGDDIVAGINGLLGMCADVLGWNRRPPAEKHQNVVVAPPSPDGRMEWLLRGAPPSMLAHQLGNYYPDLPMVTTLESNNNVVAIH